MNRAEFQELAELRIDEAGVLLAAGKWDGAYYLAGYTIECGLKACILARVEREGAIFEDKKFSEKCWTHRFDELLALAGLETARTAEAVSKPRFETFRRLAEKWREDARYRRIPQVDADELYRAISDPTDGVMQWIRSRW